MEKLIKLYDKYKKPAYAPANIIITINAYMGKSKQPVMVGISAGNGNIVNSMPSKIEIMKHTMEGFLSGEVKPILKKEYESREDLYLDFANFEQHFLQIVAENLGLVTSINPLQKFKDLGFMETK